MYIMKSIPYANVLLQELRDSEIETRFCSAAIMLTIALLCGFLAISSNAMSIPSHKSDHEARTKDTNLQATLAQINSTHCRLQIINDGDEDLKLLKWNTLFDSNAESHSFTIRSLSTNKTLPPGSQMVRKIYEHVSPHHILNLAAKSFWTGTYDLTRLFDIPTTSNYEVSFSGALTILSPHSSSLKDSQKTNVISHSVTMRLESSASAAALKKRILWFDLSDRARIHTCDNAQIWVLSTALTQAKTLARSARDAVPTMGNQKGIQTLYTTYFNDNSQQFVSQAFDKVS